MAFGLSNGTNYAGLVGNYISMQGPNLNNHIVSYGFNAYGVPVGGTGQSFGSGNAMTSSVVGVTTDPTKSGMVAEFSPNVLQASLYMKY